MTKRTLAFLSYSRKYVDWVRVLHSNLERILGTGRIELDELELHVGEHPTEQLDAKVRDSDRLILIASPESMSSPWVVREFATFEQEHPNWSGENRVIVVDLVECVKLDPLSGRISIDLRDPVTLKENFQRLIAALRGLGPRERPELPGDLEPLPALDPPLPDGVFRTFVDAFTPLLGRGQNDRLIFGNSLDPKCGVSLKTQRDPRLAAQAAYAHLSRNTKKPPPVILRELIDTAKQTFSDMTTEVAKLDDLLKLLPGTDRPTDSTLIAEFRKFLRDYHSSINALFEDRIHRALEKIHVDIYIDPRRDRADVEPMKSGATTLRSLLEQPIDRSAGNTGTWHILGEPGAGKSTIARHLTWTLAGEPNGPIALYVTIARCRKDDKHPLDIVASDFARTQRPDRADKLKQQLIEQLWDLAKRGRVFLLLDGLDEIPSQPDSISETLAWIESLAPSLAPSPVAVLSRDHSVLHLPESFVGARLSKLDAKKRGELIEKLLSREQARAFTRAIENNHRMADLVGNPLLLTMAASVIRSGKTAPTNRSELYERVVELLLRGPWKPGQSDRLPEHVKPVRSWLGRLGLALQDAGTSAWTKDELCQALSTLHSPKGPGRVAKRDPSFCFADSGAFLEEVKHVIGPFQGIAEPWTFLHRQFREFLAAERLLELGEKQCIERAKKLEDDHLPQWSEVFAFVAAKSKRPLEFLNALRQVSAPLVLRALPNVDGVAPNELLALLMETDGWEYVDLWRLASALPHGTEAEREAIRALLWPYVGKLGDTDRLAYLHLTLENLGIVVDRGAFFTACERPIVDDPSIEWVKIPAGSFAREQDGVAVAIPAFELAKTVITRAQYRAFDPDHESTKCELPPGEHDDELPVTDVSWWSAYLYCAWIRARLPSEWEWEYACRAGSTTAYSFGDDEKDLADHAWYFRNSGRELLPIDTERDWDKAISVRKCRPHPVGRKPSNRYGLLDMHGNVWEWCRDAWNESVMDAPEDGRARIEDASPIRVGRGGSFWFPAVGLRSAYRNGVGAGSRWSFLGFRPARPLAP